jgi:HopA1 effector protein family
MTIHDELAPALQALAIHSWNSFSFAGGELIVMPPALQPAPQYALPQAPGAAHTAPHWPLATGIQATLYNECYVKRFPRRGPSEDGGAPSETPFAQALSSNNLTQNRWDLNWRIYAVGQNGQLFLQKGEFQHTAMPGEYISQGAPLQPGAYVNLWIQRESAQAQPGFYFVYSETPTDAWDEFELLRYYFHATAKSAPALIRYWTGELNRFRVPFRLKTLTEVTQYTRTDAMVLYFARRYHPLAARLALQMPADVADGLRPETPLFARTLRPGVGIAEDPNTGESFGMHRCRLTAEGILDAWATGLQTVDARLRAIEARFRAAQLNLDRPHLSPGSSDLEDVPEKVDFNL